jgi:hypothetical protein
MRQLVEGDPIGILFSCSHIPSSRRPPATARILSNAVAHRRRYECQDRNYETELWSERNPVCELRHGWSRFVVGRGGAPVMDSTSYLVAVTCSRIIRARASKMRPRSVIRKLRVVRSNSRVPSSSSSRAIW